MTLRELEKRLTVLEHRVEGILEAGPSSHSTAPPPRWWVDAAGRFADDPIFDEIVKLGRSYRASLRPGKNGGKKSQSRGHAVAKKPARTTTR